MIDSFDVVMLSVGPHLNPSPANFLAIHNSSVRNDVMLFDSYSESIWTG